MIMASPNESALIMNTQKWLKKLGYKNYSTREYISDSSVKPDLVMLDEEENHLVVVEIKGGVASQSHSAKIQLTYYMRFIGATYGVLITPDSKNFYQLMKEDFLVEIPMIPPVGSQSFLFKLASLKTLENPERISLNLYKIMRRNNPAFNQQIELGKVLLCKLLDEQLNPENLAIHLSGHNGTKGGINAASLKYVIKEMFNVVKEKYSGVFNASDKINIQDEVLLKIIGELQSYSITKSRSVFAKILSRLYDLDNKGRGMFQTPVSAIHVLFSVLDINNNNSLLEIGTGTGGFLTELLANLMGKDVNYSLPGDFKNRVFGVEVEPTVAMVAKICFVIFEANPDNVVVQDFLSSNFTIPKMLSGSVSQGFDYIISDPPINTYYYRQKGSGREQIALAMLNKAIEMGNFGGKIAFLMPESFLISKLFYNYRKELLEHTRMVAIISLPKGFRLPQTSIRMCWVILEKVKENEPQGSVFVAQLSGSENDNEVTLDFKRNKSRKGKSKWITVIDLENSWLPNFHLSEKEHNTTTLGDICAITRGRYISSAHYRYELTKDTVPYVRISDLRNLTVNEERMVFVSMNSQNKRNTTLNGGEILISASGTIGKVAIVPKTLSGAEVSSQIIVLRPNIGKVDPRFLLYSLLKEGAIQQMDHLRSGTIIDHMTIQAVKSLRISLPSVSIQGKIADRIDKALLEKGQGANLRINIVEVVKKIFGGL